VISLAVYFLLQSSLVFHFSCRFFFKWVGEKQKEFDVNSMQLLLYQAPMSAVFLMFVIPFFENLVGPYGVFSDWSKEAQVGCIMNKSY
jgi:hypothetical protein